MRELNIEHKKGTQPELIFFDAETGDPLKFIKSVNIYIDIDNFKCSVEKYVIDKDKKEGESITVNGVTDIEHFKINKIESV